MDSLLRHIHGNIPDFIWDVPWEINFLTISIFYLYKTIINISPIFFIGFLIGSIIIANKKFANKTILVLWILIPYITLSLISIKRDRYYFPVFPACALITSIGISKLRNKKTKNLIFTTLIFAGFLQIISLTFNVNLLPSSIFNNQSTSIWARLPQQNNYNVVIDKLLTKHVRSQTKQLVVISGNKIFIKDKARLIEYLITMKHFPAILPYVLTFSEFMNQYESGKNFDMVIFTDDPETKSLKKILKDNFLVRGNAILAPEEIMIFLLEKK